jgi:glycosyltransferase involved in cell wall biosynthesis
MKPRVLLVCQHYAPESFRSTDIAEYFVENGCEVDVLCGLPNYPRGVWSPGYSYKGPYFEERNGVRVFRAFEVRRKNDTAFRIAANFLSWPFFASRRLRGLLKRNRYDAVLSFQLSPVHMAKPALKAARRLKVPCTIYVLDIWPDNLYSVMSVPKFAQRMLQRTANRIYAKADRIVALTPAMRDVLARYSGKRAADIAVIPQFCEDFYAERPEPAPDVVALFDTDRFNILYAGNISPAQGLDNLVEAAALVEEQRPGSTHYVIVGDGMSRAAVERRCEALGVAHRMSFVGSVPAPDVPQYALQADVLFAGFAGHAALDLTIPGKYASYCAAGKPLLVAMGGEGARVTQEHQTGLVSPPDDAAALATNIQTFLAMSAAQRAEMGAHSSNLYQQMFRRDGNLRKLQSVVLEGSA